MTREGWRCFEGGRVEGQWAISSTVRDELPFSPLAKTDGMSGTMDVVSIKHLDLTSCPNLRP